MNMNWHLSLFTFDIISLGKKQVVEVKLVALMICALKTLTRTAKLLWRTKLCLFILPLLEEVATFLRAGMVSGAACFMFSSFTPGPELALDNKGVT